MVDIPAILSILAFVTYLITIGALIYKVGKRDQRLDDLCKCNLPDRVLGLEGKQEVLWAAFSDQVLSRRNDLANRGSPYKLTPQAQEAVGEVMGLLAGKGVDITADHVSVSERVLAMLPKGLGSNELREVAMRHHMTISELMAIISIDLGLEI